MRVTLAATTLLIMTAGSGWAQTAGCGDVVNDPSASCPSILDPAAGGSVNSGVTTSRSASGAAIGSSGQVIDRITTDAIPNAPQPRGMAPLDVPTTLGPQDRAGSSNGIVTRDRAPGAQFSNPGVSAPRTASPSAN